MKMLGYIKKDGTQRKVAKRAQTRSFNTISGDFTDPISHSFLTPPPSSPSVSHRQPLFVRDVLEVNTKKMVPVKIFVRHLSLIRERTYGYFAVGHRLTFGNEATLTPPFLVMGTEICIGSPTERRHYIRSFLHLYKETQRHTLRASLSDTILQKQLSTDAVSALRKVWVLIRLWQQHCVQVRT